MNGYRQDLKYFNEERVVNSIVEIASILKTQEFKTNVYNIYL